MKLLLSAMLALLFAIGCQATESTVAQNEDQTIVYKDGDVVVHGVTYPTLGGLMCHTVVAVGKWGIRNPSVSTSCVSSN